jgi:peptidoglycan/LPS O-acetylase OafA/YrhL
VSAVPPHEARRLDLVQAARGVAALLVLLYHCTETIGLPKYAGAQPWLGLFRFGHAGVDFFFVLSGFIITYAHHADIGRSGAVARYAWRRLTRIYPAYWVCLAVACALYAAFPDSGPSYAREPLSILLSAVLWPQAHLPVIGVAWTLSHEMLFYILFGLAILWPRSILAVFVVWQAAVLLYAPFTPGSDVPPFLLYSVNSGFGVGVGVAFLGFARPSRHPAAFALIGAAAFLAVGLLENRGPITNGPGWHFSYIAAAGVLLYGIFGLDMRGARIPRVAVFIGAASYSIYLVHTLVVSAGCKVLISFAHLSGNSAFPIVAAFALMCGIAFHIAIERPIDGWARSRRFAASPRSGQAVRRLR